MRKMLLIAAFAVGALLLKSGSVLAGLTVSLTVSHQVGNQIVTEPVTLFPILPGTGTPDNNGPNENGYVAVAGIGLNIDDDRHPDLFIDALTVTSEKTSSEGKVTTINISTRLLGTNPVDIAISAFDDFGLPITGPNSSLLITSSFLDVNVGLDTPIVLTSYLDNNPIVSATVGSYSALSTVAASQSAIGYTSENAPPFRLGSEFRFSLAPNSTVAFQAESIASAVSIAHMPEVPSAVAWGALAGIVAVAYGFQKRSRRQSA